MQRPAPAGKAYSSKLYRRRLNPEEFSVHDLVDQIRDPDLAADVRVSRLPGAQPVAHFREPPAGGPSSAATRM